MPDDPKSLTDLDSLHAYLKANDVVQKIVRDMINIIFDPAASQTEREMAESTLREALQTKPMNILKEPLTIEEIKAQAKDGWISGIIEMSMDELIDYSLQGAYVLEIMSERLTGPNILEETSYEVVGNDKNTLHIRVKGRNRSSKPRRF